MLAAVGLVTERRFGTYALYEFNRRHWLARSVHALFEAEATAGEELVALLAARVGGCRDARAAVLADDPHDDVQMVVLTAPGRDLDVMAALEPLSLEVRHRFGCRLQTTVIERRRALDLVRRGNPRWRRIASTAIPVYRVFPRVR